MPKLSSEIAYDHIRARIRSGEYPPGHALVTELVAREAGVSRTPVREALHRLAVDGLVEILPRRGATVKRLDDVDYRDFYGQRLALEGYAAMMAARRHTPADLLPITAALEALRRHTAEILTDDSDATAHSGLIQQDVRFHVGILAAARNELIRSEVLRLHLVERMLCGPAGRRISWRTEFASKRAHDENRRRVLAFHEDIYAAIVRRDGAGARDAMERHLENLGVESDSSARERALTEEELAYIS